MRCFHSQSLLASISSFKRTVFHLFESDSSGAKSRVSFKCPGSDLTSPRLTPSHTPVSLERILEILSPSSPIQSSALRARRCSPERRWSLVRSQPRLQRSLAGPNPEIQTKPCLFPAIPTFPFPLLCVRGKAGLRHATVISSFSPASEPRPVSPGSAPVTWS